MKRCTRVVLYFASYGGMFVGAGFVIIGLGLTVSGLLMAGQCRREDREEDEHVSRGGELAGDSG